MTHFLGGRRKDLIVSIIGVTVVDFVGDSLERLFKVDVTHHGRVVDESNIVGETRGRMTCWASRLKGRKGRAKIRFER